MNRDRPLVNRPRTLALCCLIAALLASQVAVGSARRSLRYRLPEDVVERFAFEATHSVRTAFSRLPPEAEPFDVASIEARFGQVDTVLRGTIERMVARVFRDRSLGLVTRLVGLSGTIDRGEGAGELDLTRLEGKSLAMRLHSSGEVLDSFGWSHFSGGGRAGDLVQEVLLQQILRLPHVPPKSDRVGTTFQLRLPIDPMLERTQLWVLAWTQAEGEQTCRGCLVLDYEGEVREDSTDQHPARPTKLDGVAKVSGRMVLEGGVRARQLLSHRWSFTWDRTIRSERDNGTVRGELTQTATIEGRLWKEAE